MPESAILIPTAKRLAWLKGIFGEDEFRLPRIKLNREAPMFTVPNIDDPNDPDKFEMVRTFDAVVIFAKKNYYQSDEDKAAGKDVTEKRELYLIPVGTFAPQMMYLSPTSMRPWQMFVADLYKKGQTYSSVIARFSAEKATSKNNSYVWNKVKIEPVRAVTEEEHEHVLALHGMIDVILERYRSGEELADIENQALGIEAPPKKQVDDPERRSRAALANPPSDVDDEDEDTPSPPKKQPKATAPLDDEEEPPAPPPAKKKPAPPVDDEETPTPRRPRAAAPPVDDEDAPKPTTRPAAAKKPSPAATAADSLDDEEEPAPPPKKKPTPVAPPSMDDEEDL